MIDVHKSDRNSEWYKPRGAAIELWESRRDPRSFSVVSWKHFHRYNCLQNGKVWKDPQTFCIVNMAMSDLLFPILQFPQIVIELFSDSRLIDSSLGQDLCKVVFSLPYSSLSISIRSMILIEQWYSLSTHQFEAVPCLYYHHLDYISYLELSISVWTWSVFMTLQGGKHAEFMKLSP